jgi:hypothetical protein
VGFFGFAVAGSFGVTLLQQLASVLDANVFYPEAVGDDPVGAKLADDRLGGGVPASTNNAKGIVWGSAVPSMLGIMYPKCGDERACGTTQLTGRELACCGLRLLGVITDNPRWASQWRPD